MSKRHFHLGDILTITTGRLVSPSRMDGVYAILDYMTGDSLFTHQLPRAAKECEPWLLRQHPQLAGVSVATLETALQGGDPESAVDDWLRAQVATYGETLPVEPIPADDHERKHPVSELQEMIGRDRVHIIELPPDGDTQ